MMDFQGKGFAFCGYSGSGKTTLISALIARLATRLRIAYLKHDAHAFEMDYPAKDTHRVFESGARTVVINSPSKWAAIGRGIEDFREQLKHLASHELVFVEGYKESFLPKAVLLDRENRIVLDGTVERLKNVTCLIGLRPDQRSLLPNLPFFLRDQVESIEHLVLKTLGIGGVL